MMMSDIIMRIFLVDESERKTGFDSPQYYQASTKWAVRRTSNAGGSTNEPYHQEGAREKCQDDKDYDEMSNSSATGVSERRLCSTLHMIHCFVLRH